MPLSAGNGCSETRSSANARRVISMLCAMYGVSFTSSFGFTMKPFTYAPSTLTMRKQAAAGTTAATSQRIFGAETALTSAIAAPTSSAPETTSMPVSVTCASV